MKKARLSFRKGLLKEKDKQEREKERERMAKVGIVMGSDSDMPVMAQAAAILEKLGVDFAMRF